MVSGWFLSPSFVRAALLPLAMSFHACQASPPHPRPSTIITTSPASSSTAEQASDADRNTVVLVVIDGVRWQEVFGGVDRRLAAAVGMDESETIGAAALLPNLHRVFAGQADSVLLGDVDRGDDVVASGPNYVSMPGYTEIFGGRPSDCKDNDCAGATRPTIVDDMMAGPGARAHDAAIVASWEAIPRAASQRRGAALESAGRDRLETPSAWSDATRSLVESSGHVNPWPGSGRYRPDAFTAKVALQVLEDRAPRFLFVGLGDTDEHAHHGDYRGYLGALREADRVVGELVAKLDRIAKTGGGSRTGIVVTTDHGRAHNFRDHGGAAPESRHVWLAARWWSSGELTFGGVPLSASLDYARGSLSDVNALLRRMMGLGVVH